MNDVRDDNRSFQFFKQKLLKTLIKAITVRNENLEGDLRVFYMIKGPWLLKEINNFILRVFSRIIERIVTIQLREAVKNACLEANFIFEQDDMNI